MKNRIVKYRVPWRNAEIERGGLSAAFRYNGGEPLTSIIGENSAGPVALKLKTAPHVIIAGTTGSGKSVCIQTIINCLLLKNSPARLKLIFIDPKKIDYIMYKDIAHTDNYVSTVPEIVAALRRECYIMDQRYKTMQNCRIYDADKIGLPARVIVFDELPALLDGPAKKAIMPFLKNLLRLGRAAGIHVIIGSQIANSTIIDTQVKANCPVRIAFRVTSAMQSRVIIERNGAETLPGRGAGILFDQFGNITRFQGYMTAEDQQNTIINYWNDAKNYIVK